MFESEGSTVHHLEILAIPQTISLANHWYPMGVQDAVIATEDSGMG